MSNLQDIVLVPGIVVIVIVILGIAFWARYKTVGPDEGMIVTGSFLGNKNISEDDSGRKIKIVRGGGPSFGQFSSSPNSSLCCPINWT